jgi:Leucine-rich repeat (LRR) protein
VSVRCTSTPIAESITGVWADGRVGTYRGIKKGGLRYSATVFGDKGVSSAGVYGHGVPVKGVVPTTDKYMGYEGLAIEMAKFFKGGPVPVSADETLEIFAFMEAAHESKRQKGSEVIVADILDKARRTVVATRPDHPDAAALRKIAVATVEAKIDGGKPDSATMKHVRGLVAGLTDAQVRSNMTTLLPSWEHSAARHGRDRELLADIKRLGGKAISEVIAPDWLREIVGDDGLSAFDRIVEIDLNERTDGHKDPVPKKLADRVTDDWLAKIADQTELRRLELSGTAVTSVSLVHLKALTNLERLNVCLTAVDDRGLEHLAGLTKIKRMVVCSSKITGVGFQHLQACKQIESINLHSSPASDAGLEVIGKLTSLRRLEIVHTNVTDAGLKHLAGLVNLQQLHIHGVKTTESALPFIGQLKQLYELDIYDRAASNHTLEQVGKLSKLRLLMLVNGNFDDDGVRHLAKLTTLEELSLDSSKLTEASIEHLAGMRNLRKLHLGRTKITAAGRDRLKMLLPTIEIAR